MMNLISRRITNGHRTERLEYGWDGERGPIIDRYTGKRAIRLARIVATHKARYPNA